MQIIRTALFIAALFAAQQAAAHTPAYFGFMPKVEFSEPAPGAAKHVRAITFTGVDAGSPAARAGILAGDEVLELDSKPLTAWTDAQFDRFVHALKPGKRLKLKLRHADGGTATVTVVGIRH